MVATRIFIIFNPIRGFSRSNLTGLIFQLGCFNHHLDMFEFFGGIFPQTGLPVGFYLRTKIDWTRCWARWAWLGADLALLGALGWLGVGFGSAGRGRGVGRAVGWAWGLAVLGALAGLGVGLAVLGALAGLGVLGAPAGLGVFGRAGRAGWVGRGVGRGVWPCWARWLGWSWCWAWGLAVLGALAGLGVVLGVGFGRAGRAGWVGRGFKVQTYTLEIQK